MSDEKPKDPLWPYEGTPVEQHIQHMQWCFEQGGYDVNDLRWDCWALVELVLKQQAPTP